MFHLTLPIFILGMFFCMFFLFTQDADKAAKYTINTTGILFLLFVIFIVTALTN